MNQQRESFKGKVADHMKTGGASGAGATGGDGGSETRIENHGDGTFTIHHSDGEKSGPHPSMARAAMELIGKHDGGEHGHIMPHPGGGATTHHVTMDGGVQGPTDHESEDEAYSSLKGNIGDGAEVSGGERAPMMSEEDTSFA